MKIPAQIRAGDTVKWRDDAAADGFGNAITSTTWVLTYYLRANVAAEAATVVGTAFGPGWEFTIAAGTSAAFDAGQGYWQAIATYSTEKLTLGAGQLEVLQALSYTGAPGAIDGRTQLQEDLDAVKAAIRAATRKQAKSQGGAKIKQTLC